MQLEAILLPTFGNLREVKKLTSNKNLQLIPVLDIKGVMPELSKEFRECRAAGSQDIPIIAFKFSTYPNANKGYDMVMDDLDKIHEDGQATMLVDVSRSLQSPDCLSVSAPHYGAFIMADIVAERYYGQIGRRANKRNNAVRLFCKNDLITPLIEDGSKSKKFELESELQVFSHDKKLQELLTRITNGKTSETDWLNNRPHYLSRVHESVRTREQFEEFKRSICSNEVNEYLKDKKDMNFVVSDHLKNRSK